MHYFYKQLSQNTKIKKLVQSKRLASKQQRIFAWNQLKLQNAVKQNQQQLINLISFHFLNTIFKQNKQGASFIYFWSQLRSLEYYHQVLTLFKDKFQELIGYVKTRDLRIEQFEKEVAKKDKTLSEQRRHQQMMLDECDYNSKICEKVMANSKQVETQLSVKEKNEAQLIQDKQAEKTRFELERSQLKKKGETMIRINQLIAIMKNKLNIINIKILIRKNQSQRNLWRIGQVSRVLQNII